MKFACCVVRSRSANLARGSIRERVTFSATTQMIEVIVFAKVKASSMRQSVARTKAKILITELQSVS